MRRMLVTSSATAVAIVALTSFALAQKPGAHVLEEPVCTLSDDSSSITCTNGSAAGLGNQPVTVSATCPAGCSTRPDSNDPPGHAQFQSEPIDPRGGRINFPDFTLSADCPAGLVSFVGTTVTYTIARADGTIVLTFQVIAS